MRWKGIISQYGEYLPTLASEAIVTLHEGNTPLLRARQLEAHLSQALRIYLKCEGSNPTGSFKDRGMTVAVSKAVEEGSKAVICASTGNTAASAAAYAARAGLKCYVLVPKGNVALGKLAQATMHGAKVLQIEGLFDEALELVLQITEAHKITLVNSLNPFRIEGQKTAAFEVCDELEDAPDYHALPVGNAGNITAYWKGYKEYRERGVIERLPKMLGFQAEGAAPIVRGQIVRNPETVATAIKIGNPASWQAAVAARDESGGLIDAVSDQEILRAYSMLAELEGVFCEPASAASVAGLLKLAKNGYFASKATVVCTLTGHGLKDPERAMDCAPEPIQVPAEMRSILAEMGI
ncbi:MAG: threonine synthase [Candidatus Fraserbacteria bacterium RBG_16_55_9]|uniref:Threonine synthase n=1 Tax=Fraserbacteria sp. (strain RBG_16_55_9) TaxID=1817864 RepID=A0A1F5UWJ0_FRAXR|nr:MAG: threonine synthase [Candidatus Fraserbacteria bacterium RBG_16_55_9]